jgi:hypothetical protein
MNVRCGTILVAVFLAAVANLHALSIIDQEPNLERYQNFTVRPMRVQFDESIDPATVTHGNVAVALESAPSEPLDVVFALESRNRANDTLVIAPTENGGRWPFARRLVLHLAAGLRSIGGHAFDGGFPWGAVFVANIPNDMDVLQEWDPGDPGDFVDAFANANVLVGYNPIDPENTDPSDPASIPGMGATEAWKLTAGRPDVIIAVVDDGIERYDYPEMEENYFLNRGELDAPTLGGSPCAPDPYDCNADGKFNVRDYDADPRFTDLGRMVTIPDLFDAFEDGFDDDGNGLPDDISGWDFLRGANKALGVADFPEGGHGEDRGRDAAGIADNGKDDKPGYCPRCTVLQVRVSDSVMTEINTLAAGIRYAYDMGARVAVFASESLNASRDVNDLFTEVSEGGMALVGVASDEDSYHHAYPGAFDDVINVKAIFPIPPIDFLGVVPMRIFGFTETYCTMWGEHVHLSGSSGACSSEAAGNIAGFAGLVYARAADLGIALTAGEVKQILTLSADDIYEHCLTWTGGGCQEGWDAHFGYGRPNAKAALAMLGDPDSGAPERIPPEVKFRSPAWYTTVDPIVTPAVEVAAKLSARGRAFRWTVESAVGKEPAEEEFAIVATGDGAETIDGPIAAVDVSRLLPADVYTKPPRESFDFSVTLRVRAEYDLPGFGTVRGEDRRTINVHRDREPGMGLLPGFPLDLGGSGRASVTLYDLDGDADGRLEVIAATSGKDGVVALKYDEAAGAYAVMDGFPVSVAENDGLDLAAGVSLSHPAVGDLLGDGEPWIVVSTHAGAVIVIHRLGNAHRDGDGAPAPVLTGFPVHALEPDNSGTEEFGHGRAFGGSPVLADLDGDGLLEIIAGSYDGRVYAWRPYDGDGDGAADNAPGFPVLCRSDEGAVPEEAVCHREDERFAPQITVSPAAGILDPDSANPDIAFFPSVLVGTSEVCTGGMLGLKDTRFYAIFHDGTLNASGSPFVPGFPARLFGPISDLLPLPPVTIGITSSPALARENGTTYIGVGSAIWFPQVIEIKDGQVAARTLMTAPGFNALAHGSFGRLQPGGPLHFVLPISSILDTIDGWISLLKPMLVAWSVADLDTLALEADQHDSNWYLSAAIADISGDGRAEIVAGDGGFTVTAVDMDGQSPPSWPKFTGHWSASSPTVGDADGDGRLEVYQTTLEGALFGWETQGETCNADGQTAEWWTAGHDERNTGAYGVDTQPPSVVTDLSVREDGGGYRLAFTSPGDDWRCGAPAAYDIRRAADRASLAEPALFGQAASIPVGLIPAPVPGGEAVELTVPADGGGPWFAVRAVDDAGNVSLVGAPATVPAPPDDDDASGADDDDDDDQGCGC